MVITFHIANTTINGPGNTSDDVIADVSYELLNS